MLFVQSEEVRCTMQNMASNPIVLGKSVVYFPSIEFQDEEWLRSALCIWDSIHRIVPSDYQPQDSDDVRRLEDAGLLGRIVLAKSDLEGARLSFAELLESNPCQPSALSGTPEEFAFLHKDKVGERLHNFFIEQGHPLNTSNDDDGDGWFRGPASVIHAYMMHLAETVARRRGMSKVTDSKDTFSVAPFVDADGNIDDMGLNEDVKGCHAALNFTTILPRSVRYMPVDNLIQFRHENQDGRRALCNLVEETAQRIQSIEDMQSAQLVINDLGDSLAKSKAAIASQKTYDGKDLMTACLSVGVPTAIGLTLGATVLTPIVAGTAVSVAIIASMATAYAARKSISVDPVRSYYVGLETTADAVCRSRSPFKPNDFWAVMEEYIND